MYGLISKYLFTFRDPVSKSVTYNFGSSSSSLSDTDTSGSDSMWLPAEAMFTA